MRGRDRFLAHGIQFVLLNSPWMHIPRLILIDGFVSAVVSGRRFISGSACISILYHFSLQPGDKGRPIRVAGDQHVFRVYILSELIFANATCRYAV